MEQPSNVPAANSDPEAVNRLEQAVATLARSIEFLDLLGMSTAAGHVSLGYELAIEELRSLRNGVG